MEVPVIFKTIEESGISTWIRDSPSFFAFWFILSFHAIGMGLLVGASLVIDLRILGVARELPLGPLQVARLDNDPNYPDHGQLTLALEGGK